MNKRSIMRDQKTIVWAVHTVVHHIQMIVFVPWDRKVCLKLLSFLTDFNVCFKYQVIELSCASDVTDNSYQQRLKQFRCLFFLYHRFSIASEVHFSRISVHLVCFSRSEKMIRSWSFRRDDIFAQIRLWCIVLFLSGKVESKLLACVQRSSVDISEDVSNEIQMLE